MNWLVYIAQTLNADEVGIPRTSDVAVFDGILNVVYFLGGLICVLVIIIAGFTYVTSAGESNSVKKAKSAILYAAIGIVVILLAFVITQFVIGAF